MNRRALFVVLTCLTAILSFGAAVLLHQQQQRRMAESKAEQLQTLLVRAYSPILGRTDAPVTVVEFFDPACEACRAFHPYVKGILSRYPDEIRLVLRYAPFHEEASVVGIQILESARAEGQLPEVLNALLDAQPEWASHESPSAEKAWKVATAAGLSQTSMGAAGISSALRQLLVQELEDIRTIGVRATPTFYVNGRPLSRPDPQLLAEMVEAEVISARDRK